MRVSDIRFHTGGEFCEVYAEVCGEVLKEPFRLWYRFPAIAGPFISTNYGNLLIAALLLPAMKTGEPLEVPVPISPRLYHSLKWVQTIYRAWDRTLSQVEVRAPLREYIPPAGKEVGLFFSAGVDSFYSLIKNTKDHPLNEDVITQLIIVHGVDIQIGKWKSDVFARMLSNAHAVAEQFGKGAIGVATNAKDLIGWGWLAQGATLASVGLALEGMLRKVYIAANGSYDDLQPDSTHPLLDPLWSTEACEFIHDGLEANRLDKIRLLAQSDIATRSLRVCWAKERPEYNCGQCAKCLRTMLGLHIAGALEQCRTLPNTIDPELLRKIPLLYPDEFSFFQDLLDELGESEIDVNIRTALLEGLAKGQSYFEHLEQAKRTIGRMIPLGDKFILVDQDTIRQKIGAGRGIIPFLERDGQYNGLPPDDETAIHELERLKGEGAKFIVFWWADFWWLEYYSGFNRHLHSRYRHVVEDDSVVIFDLRNSPKIEGADA